MTATVGTGAHGPRPATAAPEAHGGPDGIAGVGEAEASRDGRPARRIVARYVHHPVLDVAVAFCWIPFAVAAHALQDRGDTQLLALFISGVFLLSFAHQPLTVALVYGDPDQFRLKRAIFTWSPLVFVVAVVAGFYVSLVLVAVIGGLWNAEHTLMQRYGITRIYGRKVGQDDGGIEKAMLFSWLVLALVWVAADTATPGRIAAVNLGQNNRMALEVLTSLQSFAALLLVPLALGAVVLLGVWAAREVRRPQLNAAKWMYLGSTAVLLSLAVVDPLAAIMGYVGSHAVEYFVIVHQSLGRRYAPLEPGAAPTGDATGGGGILGRVVRARTGRIGFLAAYVALVILAITVLGRLQSPLAYTVVFFTLGGMHVFYDGFIWKLRRPEVAQSLAVPTAAG